VGVQLLLYRLNGCCFDIICVGGAELIWRMFGCWLFVFELIFV